MNKIMSKFRYRKLAFRLALFLILPISLVAVAGTLWLRTSLPGLSENIALRSLENPVDIIHDSNGIPISTPNQLKMPTGLSASLMHATVCSRWTSCGVSVPDACLK